MALQDLSPSGLSFRLEHELPGIEVCSPLRSVVVIGLMATVCGCDDAEAMQLWGEHNADWLAGFLDLPHGAPTQDVFLSVFGALDPEAFSAVFRSWAALLALRLRAEGKHIAVDGKTSRRSLDSETGRPTVHTVSAWMSEAGLVLGGPVAELGVPRHGEPRAHRHGDGEELFREGLLHRQ